MTDKNLTMLSRIQLLDLFLEVNDQLDENCNAPRAVYMKDPNYHHNEETLLAIIIEIGKRYRT